MPNPQTETIRRALIGSLTDFAQDAGFIHHINLIVELVCQLSEYREEDTTFFPEVYLIEQPDQQDTLSMLAPGADRFAIGRVPYSDGLGASILKRVATLAEHGWAVYCILSRTTVDYGVFRAELLPVSLSASDQLANPIADTGVTLLLRNCAKNCVELLASDAQRLEFSLTPTQPKSESVNMGFGALARCITSSVLEEHREASCRYIQRLLETACRRSHGTLIVVLSDASERLPDEFADGVVLPVPVAVVGALINFATDRTADSLARVHAIEALVRGMICSDGITVFNTKGEILAFRVFVKPDDNERTMIEADATAGGARSRAFFLCRCRTAKQLMAAFMRSQDGVTKCEVST